MEQQLIFQILGIKELKDERTVKSAYMEKLKVTNPEDDPEGFRRLREAYEQAVELLRAPDEEIEDKEKTELELWVDKIDRVYLDFRTRGDVEEWEELLSDELCKNLDTSLDARNAAINYLLSHYYLPKEIWQCLDKEFEFVNDYEQLKEHFPADFLDYVKHYLENPYWVRFEQFEMRDGASSVNVDAYIRTYLDVKNLLDCQDFENAFKKFEELSAYGVWYPLEDVEKMRIFEAKGNVEEALRFSNILSEESEAEDSPYFAEQGYIVPVCANVKWNAGDKEGAYILWSKFPENMDSKFGLMKYYLENEDTAEKSKEIAMEIWELDGSNQRVEPYITKANELILGKFERQIQEAGTQDEKNKISVEMAWCYFQNQNSEKAVEILDSFEPNEADYYSYHNLKGRALASLGRLEEAVPELRIWLSLILETVDDDSEEAKKRLRRKGTAYLMLGHCLAKTAQYEDAIAMLTRAEEEASDLGEKLSAMNTIAETFLAMNALERAADKCDQIIAIEPRYYPAFLIRQEACFKMQRAQQVVDDYYRAIEIYPAFYKPYLLAAKVFFLYRQYNDAKMVIDRAKEENVQFSDDLKLLEVKVLRNLARSNEEREFPLKIIEKLAEEVDSKNTDIEDSSEIEYETGLLYWDNNEIETAVGYVKKAIAKNPSRNQYLMILGDLQRDLRKFDEALKSYQAAKEDYGNTPGYMHSVGCCYSGMGNQKKMVECFEKALELDPNYRGLNERIADYYMDLYRNDSDEGYFYKAIEYINKEVAIDERCYSLVCRGLMYMDAMRLAEAIADFEKALTYQPEDWAAYNNMGCCYKYLGEYDKAIQCLEKSAEIVEQTELLKTLPYKNLADVYEILRQYDKSVEYYKKALQIDPKRIHYYQEIGTMYAHLGDYENAIKYFTLLGEKRGNKRHLIKLGDCYAVQKKLKKAKEYYELAILDKIEDLAVVYDLYNEYAEHMADIFEYKDAIKRLDQIEKSVAKLGTEVSANVQARHWLIKARAYYMLHKGTKAAECAKKAKEFYLTDAVSEEAFLNYAVERPWRMARIGECYMYMGETDKAFALFKEMGACQRCTHCREPKCYEGLRDMGIYYHGMKQYEKALSYYERAREICSSDPELMVVTAKLRKEIK